MKAVRRRQRVLVEALEVRQLLTLAVTSAFNNVTVPRTGSYVLTLFYVHLDDTATRTAVVEVSGSAPVSITVTGGATCCTAARLQITLQQGTNTITFTNRDDHAPSMDRITVSST